jgi:hypothetical protein
MLSMDIVATQHVVLGISIIPDLSTVRSYCNGFMVTLDRVRTLYMILAVARSNAGGGVAWLTIVSPGDIDSS